MRKTVLGSRAAAIGITLAWFLIPTAALHAQSNAVIDSILNQRTATYGDSVYMILSAAKIIPTSASVTAAMNALYARAWISPPPRADQPITFGDFSYILMKSFDVSGGIMYAIFPGPRYAARQVVYRRWSPGDLSPYQHISGMQALYVLRTFLSSRGGH